MLSSYLLPTDDYKNPNFLNIFLDNNPVIPSNMKTNTLNPEDKYQLKHLSDYRNTIGDILKQMFYEFKTCAIYGLNLEIFEFKSMSRFKIFFENVMGYQPSSQNFFHVIMGIIIILNDFLKCDMENIKYLINYVQKTAIYQDFGDTYLRSSFKLNMKYFEAIRETLLIIHDQYLDVFEWVIENTFSVYSLNPFNSKYLGEFNNNNKKDNVNEKENNKPKQNLPDENANKNTGINPNPNQNKLFGNKNNLKKVGLPPSNDDENNNRYPENTGQPNFPNKNEVKSQSNNAPSKEKNKLSSSQIELPEVEILHKNNLVRECNRYDELRYVPSDKNSINNNNNNLEKDNKNKGYGHYDHFNINNKDEYPFLNDVHNGIYDVVDIDTELKAFILEWKDLNLHDGVDTRVPVMDIRSDEYSPDLKRSFKQNQQPELYDHTKYTMNEYRELIKKKELKDTINIKEELDPKQANELKEKVKDKDPELLEGNDYKGKNLGKKYEVNKKLDKDLENKLKGIDREKEENAKKQEINNAKDKNEKLRKEKEESERISQLSHVDTIKTNNNNKGFFNKK